MDCDKSAAVQSSEPALAFDDGLMAEPSNIPSAVSLVSLDDRLQVAEAKYQALLQAATRVIDRHDKGLLSHVRRGYANSIEELRGLVFLDHSDHDVPDERAAVAHF